MPRYEILLFDADNTLFDFSLAEEIALKEALETHGISATTKVVRLYSEINDALWKKLERGEIDKYRLRYERFETLCEQLKYDCDTRALADAYTDALGRQCVMIRGAEELCHTLSKTHRMYIVTNGIGTVQRSRFARSAIREDFLGLFISEEIGCEKPARAYFDRVFEQIPQFDRAKTLIIGDSLTSDIRGGVGAGIDTCWFNPKGQKCPHEDLKITYTITSLEELYDLV